MRALCQHVKQTWQDLGVIVKDLVQLKIMCPWAKAGQLSLGYLVTRGQDERVGRYKQDVLGWNTMFGVAKRFSSGNVPA